MKNSPFFKESLAEVFGEDGEKIFVPAGHPFYPKAKKLEAERLRKEQSEEELKAIKLAQELTDELGLNDQVGEDNIMDEKKEDDPPKRDDDNDKPPSAPISAPSRTSTGKRYKLKARKGASK